MSHFKRQIPHLVAVFLLLAITISFVSCKKKNRLSVSNFSFSITPPAAALVENGTVTLTAKGISGDGEFATNPNWTVSSSTVGTLAPAIGTTVVFTASALGDAIISATFDGVVAQSQIAVVSYIPDVSEPSNIFNVYSDLGLPPAPEFESDIFVFPTTGFSIAAITNEFAPEGNEFIRALNASTNYAVFFTLDKNNTGLHKDFTAFSGGRIKFSVRISQAFILTEGFNVFIKDGPTGGEIESLKALDFSHGFSSTSTDWQTITVPVSQLAPVADLTDIEIPFGIQRTNRQNNLDFDIDAVRWEK